MPLCSSIILSVTWLEALALNFRYAILPAIVTVILFFALVTYLEFKREKVIAARGGVRNIYSDVIKAIRKMPEQRVNTTTSTITATYRNNSNKYCRIEIFTTKDLTTVKFSIKYRDKWVTTQKESFYGAMSGSELLFKIIIEFPDCDLSEN